MPGSPTLAELSIHPTAERSLLHHYFPSRSNSSSTNVVVISEKRELFMVDYNEAVPGPFSAVSTARRATAASHRAGQPKTSFLCNASKCTVQEGRSKMECESLLCTVVQGAVVQGDESASGPLPIVVEEP